MLSDSLSFPFISSTTAIPLFDLSSTKKGLLLLFCSFRPGRVSSLQLQPEGEDHILFLLLDTPSLYFQRKSVDVPSQMPHLSSSSFTLGGTTGVRARLYNQTRQTNQDLRAGTISLLIQHTVGFYS